MSVNKNRSKSLAQLRVFCSSPPQGMISYWWFNGLVNAFPLHFLHFSQFSKNFIGTKKTAKEKVINRFTFKLEKLLEYPITEREIITIEKMWSDLDEMIEENKKTLNN